MKILALIPARGGSKRLPGKNTRTLGGLQLIGWTIRTAKASRCFSDVLVSTDAQEIEETVLAVGASVPWLRHASLATDTVTSIDVVLDAVERWEHEKGSLDGVILLQPTSPFRTVDSIKRAVVLYKSKGRKQTVVSVASAANHPTWCFRMTTDGLEPMLGWQELKSRSQDLEPAWVLNGSIYLISAQKLKESRTFLEPKTLHFTMEDPDESIDIDTLENFIRCEEMVLSGRKVAP